MARMGARSRREAIDATKEHQDIMREFKGNTLDTRLQNAKAAKQALLEKAKQAPKIDDPAVVERRASQLAHAIKRKAERAEREAIKAATARERAEREASEASANRELAARLAAEQAELAERTAREDAARLETLAAEQKAARDARYAARKQRKG